MPFTAITLLIVLIITGASFIRSFFGFGLALVAMPFLALLISPEVSPSVSLSISTFSFSFFTILHLLCLFAIFFK